jgi:TolA-binding protein
MQPKLKSLASALVTLSLSAGLFAQSPAPSSPSKTAKKKASTAVTTQTQIEQLKQLVQTQQQQISQQNQQVQQLQSQVQQLLDSTTQANTAAQKAQSSVDQAQAAATQAQQTAADAQRTAQQATATSADVQTALTSVATKSQDQDRQLSALEALAGRFRFSGDVRIRGENFNQQDTQDRNRARIRVRFGVDGRLNEDFQAGFALATGSLGDPSSTNETLTNAFDRKTIALDRGFVTYNPVEHSWLSLTGGKFAYTWQRTSVTFDPDLNPEGFNEKASFNFNGPLQNFTMQGIELLYNESAAGQDSYALGGQISGSMKFGPWTTTPSFLTLKWNRPDALLSESAFATQTATTGSAATTTAPAVGPFPTPGENPSSGGCAKGLNLPAYAPCAFAPNGMTNATYVDAKGVAHFYSGYNYADFILNNQIQDGLARLPINLLLEFLDNLDAEAHPLSSKGKILKNLGSQNKEYGADFSLGQLKNKNDVQFGYAWYREEQDAAIASFVESDQRAPTNILQNRIYALWKLRANTVASFTWWRGRVLNTYLENNAALFNTWGGASKTISAAGQQEGDLNRLQFDLIYSF